MEEQVREWKSQYKHVYKTQIGGKDYYFRPLNRDEYLKITANQQQDPYNYDYELETVRCCLLGDSISDEELKSKSGISSVLFEQIMLRSGFEQIEVEEV